MHNIHANFAKIPLARKHYDQEFVNEGANEQTGAIIKTLHFSIFLLSSFKKHDFLEKIPTFASSIYHITIFNNNYYGLQKTRQPSATTPEK